MAVEVEIDVQVLKSEIKKTYASVSQEPEKDFIFPTGRPWAEDLGYPAELANVPDSAVGSFAGVANPWQLGRLAPGERVLDLGSGAGTDSLIAAHRGGSCTSGSSSASTATKSGSSIAASRSPATRAAMSKASGCHRRSCGPSRPQRRRRSCG